MPSKNKKKPFTIKATKKHIKSTNRAPHFYKKSPEKVSATGAKTVTLIIIGLAALMVILASFTAFFFTPEKIIKSEVESLAKNYYENIIYKKISASSEKTLDEIMAKYTETGFSRVTLRQLLILNAETHPNATAIITTYCDDSASSVKFFPEPPYGQTDYRIEYDYSCDF